MLRDLLWQKFYIKTWHSPLRIKKIEKDAINHLSDYYKKCMENDSKMIDVILSGSTFSSNIYKNAFIYNGDILEIGTPRCDIFFDKKHMQKLKLDIKKRYGLDNRKIILYAPTFRKHKTNYNYLMDFKYVYSKIKANYNLLVRSHPSQKIDFDNVNEYIDVSDYPDMQDLLCSVDILITDYSSCSFDMLIANKPCILLTKDLSEYVKNERGLYFDFKDLPFIKCNSDEDLVNIINNFKTDEYYKNSNKFKLGIGMKEIGTASKKTKELIDFKCFGGTNE